MMKHVKQKGTSIEKKILRMWLRGCTTLMLGAIMAGALNLYINESHKKVIATVENARDTALKEKKEIEEKVKAEIGIIEQHKKMKLNKKAINMFFDMKNSGVLKQKGDVFVAVANLYSLDPFRMVAISMLETANGTSDAAKNKKNICGMNWTDEELKTLKQLGYNPNIYNLKVYASEDESIMGLGFKLKTLYKDCWGLETLEEIQTKYAPKSDKRNGLMGMDNSTWAKNTIAIYKELEEVYNKLKAGE